MSGWTEGLDRSGEKAHYLWHLHDAGVIRLEHRRDGRLRYRVTDTVWDEVYATDVEPSTVAIIDNGCCTDHPHLPYGEAVLPAPCFASHDYGATHPARGAQARPFAEERAVNHFAEAAAVDGAFWGRIEALAGHGIRHAPMERFEEIVAHLREREGVARGVASYAEDFPVHGTLTAGVVAARPPEGRPGALPYFGVDPRARVLSLNTSLRPDFLSLIHALLYAVGRGADVVLIPRAVWRPERWPEEADPHRPDDLRASRLDTDTQLQVDAALFEVLLHVVGESVPVVIAAGNNGFSHAQVYPARLAGEGNGLISVGAVSGARVPGSGEAIVSGYSNRCEVTLFAPSDDAEIWDRGARRLDPDGRTVLEHGADPGEPYSSWSVLSTDIPGAFGDASGGMALHRRDEPANRRSLFAPFGGTSAACAIVAGAASLVQAARRDEGKDPLTGIEMKHHMLGASPVVARLPSGEPVARIDVRACLGLDRPARGPSGGGPPPGGAPRPAPPGAVDDT